MAVKKQAKYYLSEETHEFIANNGGSEFVEQTMRNLMISSMMSTAGADGATSVNNEVMIRNGRIHTRTMMTVVRDLYAYIMDAKGDNAKFRAKADNLRMDVEDVIDDREFGKIKQRVINNYNACDGMYVEQIRDRKLLNETMVKLVTKNAYRENITMDGLEEINKTILKMDWECYVDAIASDPVILKVYQNNGILSDDLEVVEETSMITA